MDGGDVRDCGLSAADIRAKMLMEVSVARHHLQANVVATSKKVDGFAGIQAKNTVKVWVTSFHFEQVEIPVLQEEDLGHDDQQELDSVEYQEKVFAAAFYLSFRRA